MLLQNLLADISFSGDFPADLEITDLIYDSRLVTPGCAFFCLCGTHSDGHAYAQQAAAHGAAVIFAQHPVSVAVPVLLVKNTREVLAHVSAAFFGYPARQLKTIGITGTKGKTTTSYMIRSILEQAGFHVGIIGTIGVVICGETTQINNTTPESYEVQKFLRKMADAGCDFCVMEVSSIGLKGYRVAGISFDVGIFTNFSPDHIGGDEHADMAEYLDCKSLLFRQCRLGILNIDDPHYPGIIKEHTCSLSTYGFSQQADLWAEQEQLTIRPGYLGVQFALRGKVSFPVDVSIPGKFNVYNALAAISTCLYFGVPQEKIRQGLNSVTVKGRVEPVPVPGAYTLLIDYAHNAVSMESILGTLREYHPARLICLFGAGGNRPKIRRFEMGEVSGKMADLSILTADNSRFEDVMDIIADIKVGMRKTNGAYLVIPDRRDAIRYCIEHAQPGDLIVLAGKGHEDYQEINGAKHHFDEREVISEIIAGLKGKIS